MTISKVLKEFSPGKYSDTALAMKTGNIIDHMTNNPHFVPPIAQLDDVQSALGRYLLSLGKVEDGKKEDTVNKNNDRKELEFALQILANYVQTTSDGDEAIILSSGFDVNKKPATVGPLEKATGLSINMGKNKGSVLADCDVVQNARFYEFEFTDAPSHLNSVWNNKTNTKHFLLIEGLTSGKQYAFRVAGASSDPSRSWSDEITSFVL